MKNLQDCLEATYTLTGAWPVKTIESKPPSPRSIVLLLHGYNERGLRIFRKLRRFLPQDSHIIAPNGLFPLPRVKPDRLDFGYAWYFYDKFTQTYSVDQTLCVDLLKKLLDTANPQGLPVTVIGFSQGGYLAPLLGYAQPSIKHVIGIGCEFRTRFFKGPPPFSLSAIHGSGDPLVSAAHARHEIELLRAKGINVDWHQIEDLKHEITLEVGLRVAHLMESYGKASL